MIPATVVYWEKQVAESLGISRTRVRELRKAHLSTELHWQFRDNAVVLTESGLEKLRSILLAAGQPVPAAPAAVAPISPAPAEIEPAAATRGPAAGPLKVQPGPPAKRKFMVVKKPLHRTDSPQRKILICAECPEDATQVGSWDLSRPRADLKLGVERPIRVRDNINFMPGMVLEAVEIGHGMWQYLGRLPRRQGRW